MKKAVAVDDTTVQFILTKPKANILRMWIPIVPEHIWSKISGKAASNSFQNNPPIIGSGPFQVVEYKKSGYTRMVANKDYWKGAPKIDEVVFENYTNQDTMTMDLKAGNIDVAFGVPVAQFNALKSEPGITAKAADQKYLVELRLQRVREPELAGQPGPPGHRVPPGRQLGGRQGEDRRHLHGRLCRRRPVHPGAEHR